MEINLSERECYKNEIIFNNGNYIFTQFHKNQIEKITPEEWVLIKNEELKSCILQGMSFFFGEEKMVQFLRTFLEEKETFVNERERKINPRRSNYIGVYTRFTGIINDQPLTYVRVYCPSTDRMFFLCSENKDNVKDCVASLLPVDYKKKDIDCILRQGEVFLLKVKEGAKKINTYNLSGDEYFNFLKIEA